MFNLIDHNEADIVCTLDSHIYDTNYIILNEENIGVHFVASANNVLADKQSVSIENVLTQSFLLTEKGMSYRRILDEELAKKSLEVKPVLEMGSADILCKLVQDDVGISFLPDYVTQQAVENGSIIKLDVKDFNINVWKQLIHHKDKWISPAMQVVIDSLSKITLSK